MHTNEVKNSGIKYIGCSNLFYRSLFFIRTYYYLLLIFQFLIEYVNTYLRKNRLVIIVLHGTVSTHHFNKKEL